MKVLTGREIEIIKYSACGHTAKEIARMLNLEPRTIEIYVSNIRRKLLARNIAHAVFIATRENMLDEMC